MARSAVTLLIAIFLLLGASCTNRRDSLAVSQTLELAQLVRESDLIVVAYLPDLDSAAAASPDQAVRAQVQIPITWKGSRYRFLDLFLRKDSAGVLGERGEYVLFLKTLDDTTFQLTRADMGVFPVRSTVFEGEDGSRFRRGYVSLAPIESLLTFDTALVTVRSMAMDGETLDNPLARSERGIFMDDLRVHFRELQARQVLAEEDPSDIGILFDIGNEVLGGGNSLAHLVVGARRLQFIGPLVRAGMLLDVENPKGESPFSACLARDDVECLDTLLFHGASIRMDAALLQALKGNRPQSVDWLLRNGVDVGKADREGLFPLHHAACLDIGILRSIAFVQEDLAIRTRSGQTPLERAKECGRRENVEYLAGLIRSRGERSRRESMEVLSIMDPEALLSSSSGDLAQSVAGSFFRLVHRSCGLQALALMQPEPVADSMCRAFLFAAGPRQTLGPVLLAELDALEPKQKDSLFVHYLQLTHGSRPSIHLQDHLVNPRRQLLSMHRQFENQIQSAVIGTLVSAAQEPSGRTESENP